MSKIKFSCTLCGRCCQNHNIPLTLDEAIAWLEDDGKVGIFCEADLWPSELSRDDSRAAHRRMRSFAASCGSSPVRVTALLVGLVSGRCKNLGEDLRCRIYERRPLVCRIYPAEISPFIQFNIASKACPPEAWASGPTMLAGVGIVDSDLQSLIEKSRQLDQEDVPQKSLLCGNLKIDIAAVAGEGFVTYKPHSKILLSAMRKARDTAPKTHQNDSSWRLYSPSRVTIESLQAMGIATVAKEQSDDRYFFLPSSSTQFAEASPLK